MANKMNALFELPKPTANPKDMYKPEHFILFDEITRDEKSHSGGGCYIATAVYGDYNSPEVLILRNFRDSVLARHMPGRAFIKIYYFISPLVAKRLRGAKYINRMVRRGLDALIRRL